MVNFSRIVQAHAAREPHRLAVVYGESRISYGQLAERTNRLAAALAGAGVGAGTVVSVLMKNSVAFLEIALAVSEAGGVLLPINFRLAREEVTYIANHADARMIFVDEEFQHNAPEGIRVVVVGADAQHNASLLLPQPDVPPALPVARQPEDLYRLMYTSGTTDRPKGVMHSYSNFYWKSADHIALLGLTNETRLLIAGPMYHVGAFDLPGVAVLWTGGVLVILRDFTAQAALTAIQQEKVNGVWFVPVMTTMILTFPERHAYDVSSLRWAVGGGERTPESRIREFSDYFTQARYIDAYGLTETSSGDTFMVAGREIEKIGSTGIALPTLDVSIRDESGNVLPTDVEGEICLRGPKVTKGYWRDPEKTASAFFGDWFRTGDIGRLDAENFLYLTDRKKDMIISGGENIASSEVERVILTLPEVLETAVIGMPDPRWGERPVAVVVLNAGVTIEAELVLTHCRNNLASFKVPKAVIFAEALPRNPSGKILKRVLRDELAATAEV